MQPLSTRTRNVYLYTFIALFFALLPFVIMYADGWRWAQDIGFYKTGGVFVSVPYPDAEVFLDDETIGFSGFFDRSFYVGNLAPGAYKIDVARDGYLPWTRVVVVEPQLVTDAEALLFPKRIEPTRLLFTGVATTGISVIPRAQYNTYLASFGTTSLTASTTIPQDESDGIGLFVVGGDVFARWISEDAFPSSRFCGRPSFCVREFPIEKGSDVSRSARFFRGGVVYATHEGGVYFAEADTRPTPVMVQLFEAEDPDIRVIDDTLIVKSGNDLYEISL
ncbi:MAG: hypothetical protein WA021_04015 [Minisyncoccia bacterium]